MNAPAPRAAVIALAIAGFASVAIAQAPLPPARRPSPAAQPAATAPTPEGEAAPDFFGSR